MSQNVGWIKLHRNLRNIFSHDKRLNTQLWMLYIFLAEQAVWDDFGDLKRGEIKIKPVHVQSEIFPDMPLERIEKLFRILEKKQYITTRFISKVKKQGRIIKICNYDSFCGEYVEKGVNLNRTSTEPQVNLVNLDKHIESLDNNHVNTAACTSSESQLDLTCNEPDCSYYIEKRIKEEKEELNTLPDTASQCRDPFDEIILDDQPKKTKKPPKEKPVGKSVAVINAYRAAYQHRYAVEPLINQKIRAQACKISDAIAQESIEEFIWFYLSHNDPFYLRQAHSLGICLAQIDKLHTEFQKNSYITREYVDSFNRPKLAPANQGRFRI